MPVATDSQRSSALRTWHSSIALGVYATTLGLLDGLHMALQVPRAGRPVILMHIVVGLLFYPVFTRLAVLLTRRFPLDVATWFRNVVAHMAIGLTLQYLHYLAMHTLLVVFVWPVFYPGRLFSSKVIAGISPQHFREYPIDLLAYWIVIGFVYASRYYSELGEREVAAARLEASLAEARLEVLRRQLSPHFLFNTLNAISVLALRGDNDAVVETLSRLSDLLRFAIDENHPQTVPLSEELTFLDGYLGIQQVRFGDRLSVELEVAPQTLDALVPFMILQPIVENAIEHGITVQCDKSTITIRTDVQDSQLWLRVSDSGPGFKAHRPTSASANGNGIGLANTRRRLDQLYGTQHTIECGPSPRGGASVAIHIPLEFAPPSLQEAGMIKAFIVDDESLAREGIRLMLKKETDVEVVGEAADGPSAMRSIGRLTPDVLFLDVKVPGLDGFEILDRLVHQPTPLVIFTTAYERYAVKAFEARAIDYLLKPIRAQRLREAVQRARIELSKDARAASADATAAPANRPPAAPALKPPSLRRLVVKDRDRFLLLKVSEVDWIQSAANYVQLNAHGRCYLVRMTMNELEAQLEGMNFARIHRSTIINVDRLTEIRPSPHGDFQVVLENGTALRLSRVYRDQLLPR